MSNELVINGNAVHVIEWNNQRVITTREIAIHHNMQVKIINQKFRRNQKHFTENKDYYVVATEYLRSQMATTISSMDRSDEVYLFTESGYMKFVKTINDDKAWTIYNQLVEYYFVIKNLNTIEQKFLEKSKANRKGLTAEWKDHEAGNYGLLTVAEYRALFGNNKIRKKDMDDKQLSLLSAFEFLECRKLENNQQIKGDNQLKKSVKDTGNKINSIVNGEID